MNKMLMMVLSLSLFVLSCNKSGKSTSPSTTEVPPDSAPLVTEPVVTEPVEPPKVCTQPVGAAARNPAAEERKLTGLKPIKAEEVRRMEKDHGMRKINKVRPNELGLKRINKEREKRGLSKLKQSSASTAGKDTELVGAEVGDSSAESLSGGALPAAVDNSTLPAFPPIGTQAWNSCAGWAMGYYQWSHNNGLALGWNNKANSARRCSPKFVYTMINSGLDNGAYFSDAYNLLQKHGCISWDNFPEDRDYLGWNTNPDHWRSAIPFRSNAVQYINNIDSTSGLEQVKSLLINGYVLTFGTFIESWQFTTIKFNPASTRNTLTGQQALLYVNGTQGSHAMTVVGYDDDAWTDINENNIVDYGELGVLKIANSWGTNWKNAGYAYVPYDSLKSVSGIPGGPVLGREPAFQSRMVYHLPVKAAGGVAYKPKYLAKFTLNHISRSELSLKLGWSLDTSSTATQILTPFAWMNKGGSFSFNGTSTPVTGTFVMDVSEFPVSNLSDNKFYLTVSDNKTGNPATLTGFEIIDLVNTNQAAIASLSTTADGSSRTVNVELDSYTPNMAPLAKFTAPITSGKAPLAVSLDASASSDSDGRVLSYTWSFGDGTTAGGVYASKTYSSAGQFTVTLTVKDDEGATSSVSKIITVESAEEVCQ